MRTICRFLLVGVILTLVVSCAKKHKDPDKSDKSGGAAPRLTSIDGAYVVIGMEKEGQTLTEDDVKRNLSEAERNVVIKSDRIIRYLGGKEDTATIRIDPTKNPGEIDITSNTADRSNQTNYGIYKLEGDILTICGASAGSKDRPREFKAWGGARMMTFRKK